MALNPTNIFGMIGSGLAKSITSTIKDNYSNKKKSGSNSTSNSTGSPSNEHANYIAQNFPGGYDAYTKVQQDKYNTALQNKDNDMLNKLIADSQKVGYSFQSPTSQYYDNTGLQKEIDNLLSVIDNYQNKPVNMPYPDISDFDFDDIQKQLNDLTAKAKNYKGADYMSMDESLARANSQLGGMYNQYLEEALSEYNKNAIQRGMFGQMPVEALKQNAIAENELNKSNSINNAASDMYVDDFNMAQQKNSDYYSQINQLSSLLGQQYSNEYNKYNSAVNDYTTKYNMAKQSDSDFFNTINNKFNLLKSKYDMQKDNYLTNYDVKNSTDQANRKNMLDMWNILGYANDSIADYFGVASGTPSESFNNAKFEQQLGRDDYLWKLNNTPTKPKEEDTWDWKDSQSLWDDAIKLADSLADLNSSGNKSSSGSPLRDAALNAGLDANKKNYTEDDIEKLYDYLYNLYNQDPFDRFFANGIEDEIYKRNQSLNQNEGRYKLTQ